MALNGNFVSFYSIVERVYRNAGYQQVDWTEAIEHIADALRLIGAKDAFKIVSTNGLGTSPDPLEIVDYRAALPTGYINYIAARKLKISTDGTISDFYPMVYATDLFHGTPIRKVLEDVTPGTYDTFDWDIDLDTGNAVVTPLIVEGVRNISYGDYEYTYRMNNSYIETNFETGYVELLYLSFVTDEHGFPMIPDNIDFIKAVECYIIERLDYKAWRRGTLSKQIYDDSEANWCIYADKAQIKASIPSLNQMEALKNSLLRTNQRVDSHNISFKYNNVSERRKI